MDSILRRLDQVLLVVSGSALIFMLLVTTVSVIGRYLLNSPIPDDVVMNELLMVVVVFLPFAYAQRTKQHVFVTLISDKLSPGKQHFLETAGNIIGLSFFSLLSYATFTDFWAAFEVRSFNVGVLQLPEYPSKFAVFLGLFVMAIRLLIDVITGLSGRTPGDPALQAEGEF